MSPFGYSQPLAALYRNVLRGAIASTVPSELTRFEAGQTKDGPTLDLTIYVLGVAGVGKSTLLNALLSDWMPLLPQGGVGSFTACPVRVVHRVEPYLAIRRAPRARVAKLLSELSTPVPAAHALQHARLLVQGNQFGSGSADYLAEVLREAWAGRVASSAVITDRGRLSLLVSTLAIDCTRWTVIEAGTHLPELRHELELNAAGFLSPLVTDIELGWDAPCLAAGVQLVDLPGLGVAHDLQQQQAVACLAQAPACMVVVDRSGLAEVTVSALRPLLERLTAGPDTNGPPLLIAVTHLDQIARERRADAPKGERRAWQAYFDELGEAARSLIRGQFARVFAAPRLGRDASQEQPAADARTFWVHPVAPLEHRRHHRADPLDPSAATEPEGPGILSLRRRLVEVGVAWEHRTRRELSRLVTSHAGLRATLGSALADAEQILGTDSSPGRTHDAR